MTSCSITNLGSCIIEKLFDFVVYILNLPVKPLLDMINTLLTQLVNIDMFSSVWAIIVYILSLFYGILLVIVGFRFLLSGYSAEQREKAKKSLANILIMIVLVQASFILYGLILQITASVTTVVFNMIGNNFFLITMDSLSNIGLEIILLVPYIMVLTTTLIFLGIRYLCTSIGVIFFAIGLFFYFIEPLKQYGKLILNFLFVVITLPFFYSIIFLASSKFLELALFENMKIVVMIAAFSLINFATIFLIFFVIYKAANAVAGPVSKVVAVAGMVS